MSFTILNSFSWSAQAFDLWFPLITILTALGDEWMSKKIKNAWSLFRIDLEAFFYDISQQWRCVDCDLKQLILAFLIKAHDLNLLLQLGLLLNFTLKFLKFFKLFFVFNSWWLVILQCFLLYLISPRSEIVILLCIWTRLYSWHLFIFPKLIMKARDLILITWNTSHCQGVGEHTKWPDIYLFVVWDTIKDLRGSIALFANTWLAFGCVLHEENRITHIW